MTSREAVLKDVMLSTALLSPIRVNIVDDIPETETGKLAIFRFTIQLMKLATC